MKKLVVLTGAGISQESGISTFRDHDGLWEGYDVTEVASPEGWARNRELVLDFYNQRRRQALTVEPNRGHMVIAELEKYFSTTVVTQNVDNLHERAGSTNVIHLHGSLFESKNEIDGTKVYQIEGAELNLGDTDENGVQLRPNIVWFGEMVPMMDVAIQATLSADIFIVAGTSLVVYPAAGLIDYVNDDIPKYIVDPKIPEVRSRPNLQFIPKKAGVGMDQVKDLLLKDHIL